MGCVGIGEAEGALERLYRDARLDMVRVAVLLLGSRTMAEEAVQDAFVKVAERLEVVEHPRAYLRRTVVNECRQRQRRLAVEERYRPPPAHPALPPEIDETWQAVMRLAPRRRTAVVLRFYEDLTIDQIAEIMDARPGTVSSLLNRALASLRQELA